MKLKKRQLARSRLYLVLDKGFLGHNSLSELAGKIKKSEANIVQLRDKQSKKEDIVRDAFLLRKALYGSGKLFIINDYVDVAKITDSDGVHLGQTDISVECARKILGKNKIIGVSCHNLKHALRAQDEGADYIGIGPIFPTATKNGKAIGLGVLGELRRKIKIPFFVIGGINKQNLKQAVSGGEKRAAICRAILCSPDITVAIKEFSALLN